MMAPPPLVRSGAVAEITLDRPDRGNALDRDLTIRLHEAVREVAGDRSVRAVLLLAAGPNFCVGGDLKDFAQNRHRVRAHFLELLGHMNTTISLLASIDRPVVVGLQGATAGVGVSLALAGDIRIAASNLKMRLAYTAVGLSPDGGSSYFVTRMLGSARAMELFLMNRDLQAGEAEALGLVSRVVEPAALVETARATANALAASATGAIGRAKTLVRRAQNASLEQHLRDETELMIESGESAEFAEGLDAFLAKRKPDYK